MTKYEIVVESCEPEREWYWYVVRIATVSDTETVVDAGVTQTAEEALKWAVKSRKAFVEDDDKIPDEQHPTSDCFRCGGSKSEDYH